MSDLLSIVEDPACHCIYFDRFFTSYSLLRDLHEKNFKALGAIRENRTMKCPLRPSKAVDKENREFFDYHSDDYMGSNFSNIEPTKKVKRFSQRDKKRIDCVQPFCFYLYNQGMGGVDLLDRFISQYQPSIQAKKWYWPLFLNCIEMLTVAAWSLHVTVQGSLHLDLLDFIRSVVAGLLKNSRRPAVSDPSRRRIINNSIGQHYPVNTERQGHCANSKKNTVKKCLECGVRLHPMCFLDYHK